MNQHKNSILKKSRMIFIPLVITFALMIVSLVIMFGSYKKAYTRYLECYSDIAGFNCSLSDYNLAIEEYINSNRSDFYLTGMEDAYTRAKTAASNIYGNRYSYDTQIRDNVEGLYSSFQTLTSGMNEIRSAEDMDTLKEVYSKSIHANIINLMDTTEDTLADAKECGDAAIESANNLSIIFTIIMVVCFVLFVPFSVYAIYYIRKRIVNPVVEIAGWAKLFDEGYAGMDDLSYDVDDELLDLVQSFNAVKHGLEEANNLRLANENALKRLHEEQEYKKKFVKKFYEEKQEKDVISAEAKTDGLTGLYNRRSFDAMVEEFLEKKPAGARGALYLIDMDNFKNVNDTLGHIAGDEALKTLAGAMRIVFPGAYLGRYGGDEFIVFMTTGSDEIFNSKAAELCRKMNRNFEYGGKSVHLSVSAGIATTDDYRDYSELYIRVDRALYYAKEHGRNQYKNAADLDEA